METTTTYGHTLSLDDLKNTITYYTQRNNVFDGMIACFPTSMAMAISALNGTINETGEALIISELQARGKAGLELQMDDKIWLMCNAQSTREAIQRLYPNDSWMWNGGMKDKMNQIYAVEEYIVNKYFTGIKAKVNYNLNLSSIKCVIDASGACVAGTGMYGGHMIAIFGLQYNDNGTVNYMVGDPYGDCQNNYNPSLTEYPTTWGVLQSMFGIELSI